jgi:hypothetical protein
MRRFVGNYSYIPRGEDMLEAWVYTVLQPNWALNSTVRYERFTIDANIPVNPIDLKTISIPIQFRWFNAAGMFASIGPTYLHQTADYSDNTSGSDQAILLDASVGFRLPNRRGILSLEARNLLGTKVRYQDLTYLTADPNLKGGLGSTFTPTPTVIARISVNF